MNMGLDPANPVKINTLGLGAPLPQKLVNSLVKIVFQDRSISLSVPTGMNPKVVIHMFNHG